MSIEIKEAEVSDYPKIREMACKVWRKNYKQNHFFDMFGFDYLCFNFTGGAYKNENKLYMALWKKKLAGVTGVKLFDGMVKGKKCKFFYSSWTSVDGDVVRQIIQNEGKQSILWEKLESDPRFSENEKYSISFILLAAAFVQGKKNNTKGMLYYKDLLFPSNNWLNRVCSATSFAGSDTTIKTTYPWVKPIDFNQITQKMRLPAYQKIGGKLLGIDRISKEKKFRENIVFYQTADLDECHGLVNAIAEKIGNGNFAETWSKEALAWQLSYKDLAETILFKTNGRVKGLINYIHIDLLGPLGTLKYGLIEILCAKLLNAEEQKSFFSHFFHRLKEKGVAAALFWHQGYFAERILKKAGFRKERNVHAQNFVPLSKDVDISGVKNTCTLFR